MAPSSISAGDGPWSPPPASAGASNTIWCGPVAMSDRIPFTHCTVTALAMSSPLRRYQRRPAAEPPTLRPLCQFDPHRCHMPLVGRDLRQDVNRVLQHRCLFCNEKSQETIGLRSHRGLAIFPSGNGLGLGSHALGKVHPRPAQPLPQESDLRRSKTSLLEDHGCCDLSMESLDSRNARVRLAASLARRHLHGVFDYHVRQATFRVTVVLFPPSFRWASTLEALSHRRILQAVTTTASRSETSTTTTHILFVFTRCRQEPCSSSEGSTTPPRRTFTRSWVVRSSFAISLLAWPEYVRVPEMRISRKSLRASTACTWRPSATLEL